jgi:hypothetical protein
MASMSSTLLAKTQKLEVTKANVAAAAAA